MLALFGCQSVQDKASADSLVATFTSTAPYLAAGAADPVWAKPGEKGETTVVLKAAYTADMLYMLVQYEDPINSVRRGPYQEQADGPRKKLKDPADRN